MAPAQGRARELFERTILLREGQQANSSHPDRYEENDQYYINYILRKERHDDMKVKSLDMDMFPWGGRYVKHG